MNHKLHFRLGSVLIVFGGLGFSACERNEAPKAAAPPDVLIAEAATRDVPVYREWVGTLDGSENAEIRARVSGYLLKRDYQEGGLVKKDDLLFEIDSRPFEAALAQAKSELLQGKASQLAAQPSPIAARNSSPRKSSPRRSTPTKYNSTKRASRK